MARRVDGVGLLANWLIKTAQLGLMALSILFVSCAQTDPSHLTDLAIDTYTPPANAAQVAESKAKSYWAKHQSEFSREVSYLAIESYSVDAGEIIGIYAKLIASPGVNSSDLERYENGSHLDLSCINIFDTKSGRLVGNEGYAVADLPRRGHLAQFGPYSAIFIGFGG